MKNILVKDPLSGRPWNILALHSKTVAREYILKWKRQMLHLAVNQSSKMGAVFDLTEVQRLGGRKFVVVGQLQSDVWTDPAAKKILKMSRNNQAIADQVGGGGAKTRVVTNDVTLADAVKCNGERRTNLAPNALVSVAEEESVDILSKACLLYTSPSPRDSR